MNQMKPKLLHFLTISLVCFVLLMVSTTTNAQQQQFSFTQYMDNLTPLNPAYSLLQPLGSIHTTVRKQWAGIPGAPTTYLVNGNLPIESIDASVGLIAMNDSYTVEHTNEVNLFFAKAIKFNDDSKLAVSLNGGFRSYAANYSSLSSIDASFKNDIRETTPNLGFGVMYYGSSYFVGLSVPELSIRTLGIASQQDETNFRNHYYLTAGFASTLGDDFKFKYTGLVSYAKGVPVVADLSSIMLIKEQLGLGVNVRSNKEVAGILTINVDVFHLGYSYQVGTSASNIGGYSNATHEVTLGIWLGKSK
jgi:type IX secretion system PorP/SprF family membrane protein